MNIETKFNNLHYTKFEDDCGINYSTINEDTLERKTIYFSKTEKHKDIAVIIHSIANVRKHAVTLTYDELKLMLGQMEELK